MAGMFNYLRNKLNDYVMRGVAWTPPTTYYVRLVSGTPTAGTPGTELSGSGYSRQPITKSTTAWSATNADGSTANPSTGTTGTGSNNAIVDFGTAPAAWGTADYWEIWDAPTGGNPYFFGEIVDGSGSPSPRTITSGDPVSFPISALRITWA